MNQETGLSDGKMPIAKRLVMRMRVGCGETVIVAPLPGRGGYFGRRTSGAINRRKFLKSLINRGK